MRNMKLLLSLLSLLIIGCSKNYIETDSEMVNFCVSMNAVQTRSSSDEPVPSRYIIEIYKQGNINDRLVRKVSQSGNIDVALPIGTYDFYFWADLGEGYYDASYLNMVKIVRPYIADINRVCYSGSETGVTISNHFNLNVTLKRPVARINYIKKGAASINHDITIDYKNLPTVYNVISGAIVPTEVVDVNDVTATYSSSASESVPFASDFVFPTVGNMIDILLQFDGVSKSLNGIQIQPNKQTNISF